MLFPCPEIQHDTRKCAVDILEYGAGKEEITQGSLVQGRKSSWRWCVDGFQGML